MDELDLDLDKSIEAKLYALPAGQGDCILFQFQNHNRKYHNILIDGGNRNQLEFNKQKKKILEILEDGKRGKLDLVVITHSDDDHIRGILKLLADSDLEPLVQKIWFNSERTINNYFGTKNKETQKYQIIPDTKSSKKSSRSQDNGLYKLLDGDPRWDKEVILSGKKETIGNLDITVLSPFEKNLQKLNIYWPTKPSGSVKSSSSKTFDYGIRLNEFLKKMPAFKEDTSPVNGASIALLLEWSNKKFLLLSDSFPSVVVESFKKLDFQIPIKFEVVKLSHHGSKNNTSTELLKSIDCKNYIISADANRKHFHPNKEALCRIIECNGIENTIFHFTYENSDLKSIFKMEPNVKTNFPKIKENGVFFHYEC